jgi:hypothetical protein
LSYIGDTGLIYYGNVDKVLIPGNKENTDKSNVGISRITFNSSRSATMNPDSGGENAGGGTGGLGTKNPVSNESKLY